MIEEFLQLRLDQALATCRQRWALGGVAVASIIVASGLATAGATSARGLTIMITVSTVAAVVAVSTSGTHVGAVVVALVVLQWIAFTDDTTSPRVVGVASCLFVFHALTALMAASPHTTEIDGRVLRSWALRTTVVVAATVAVWGLVILFDGRQTTGSETLTVAGLVVIAAVLLAVRRTYGTWWSASS